MSDATIMDQRLLWIFVLSVLVVLRGAGFLSIDRLICGRLGKGEA